MHYHSLNRYVSIYPTHRQVGKLTSHIPTLSGSSSVVVVVPIELISELLVVAQVRKFREACGVQTRGQEGGGIRNVVACNASPGVCKSKGLPAGDRA